MNDFLFIFRRDYQTREVQPSPDQMQQHMEQWQAWFTRLTEQNKMARPVQRWDSEGRVLKSTQTVVNGPYAEIKEAIGGAVLIKAKDYDEAVEIARECPIFELGGNVEIRMGM